MLLLIIAHITTMIASLKIKLDTYKNIYKQIGDAGYKVDFDKLIVILENQKNSNIKKIIDSILFVIPGINLINSSVCRLIETKKFNKNLEKYDVLVPMTNYEKYVYNNLESTSKKISFVLTCNTIEKEFGEIKVLSAEEVKVYLDDCNSILKNNGIAQLYYEKLPQIAYTLNEVKKLSNSINSHYKLGTIDGIKTAIIGVPEDCNIDFVIIRRDKCLEKNEYKTIEDEEVKDAKFIVYPFGIDFEESNELKQCYQDIINERTYTKKSLFNISTYTKENKSILYVKKRVK